MTPDPIRAAQRYDRETTPGVLNELAGAMAGVPRLDGAVCKGRAPDWDCDNAEDPRVPAAMAACRRCPALKACQAWVDGLPASERPAGVVGGYLPPAKPRKSVTTNRRS